jgi:hypothetical protein
MGRSFSGSVAGTLNRPFIVLLKEDRADETRDGAPYGSREAAFCERRSHFARTASDIARILAS